MNQELIELINNLFIEKTDVDFNDPETIAAIITASIKMAQIPTINDEKIISQEEIIDSITNLYDVQDKELVIGMIGKSSNVIKAQIGYHVNLDIIELVTNEYNIKPDAYNNYFHLLKSKAIIDKQKRSR